MYIILGGTGRVGSAAAGALLARGEPVTVVGHDPAKAETWRARGAVFACADIHDNDALRAVFRTGKRAFLLNPSADTSVDTDAEERRTIASILKALDGSGLQKVVAESTYGAQAGDRLGDLNTLYELEQGLAKQPIPATIQRAAYYFSNWDMALQSARDEGVVQSFFPEDFVLPMVAPKDLGESAARLLTAPIEDVGFRYAEGPKHYSPGEVAAAFSAALRKPVRVAVIPQKDWIGTFERLGFSPEAADSYARMTDLTLKGPAKPDNAIRGSTKLEDYIAALVKAGEKAAA
jgi:uncharacterized protein YbjT (DUF2867 family)